MPASVVPAPPLPVIGGAGVGRAAYLASLRSLAAARWRPLLAYCALLLAVNISRSSTVFPLGAFPSGHAWVDYQLSHVVLLVFLVGPLVFVAIVAVEALRLRGAKHVLASLVAIAVALACGFGLGALALEGAISGRLVEMNVVVSDAAFIARELWTYLASGGLLVVYVASREREAASARLAQATELDRMRTERAAAASRLKVLQARVEPELLFGVLSDVRKLFLRDPPAADALLDDLIAYLRAALPQMRGEASTLGTEVRLAAAYARAFVASPAGRLPVDERAAACFESLPFPPLVLLPIVQVLAGAQPARLTLGAERGDDGGIVIALEAQAPAAAATWSEETLAALRERLALHSGDGARLDVYARGATIALPARD